MSYVHDVNWATKGRYWNLPDFNVKGLLIHSVGCAQPKADVFVKGFNSPNIAASVSGFIEPGRFVETAPVFQEKGRAKKCYHVGGGSKGSRNGTHIGIEMTEPATIKYTGGATFKDLDPEKTKKHIREVTDTAAQVFADLCIFHDLTVGDISITSHRQSYLEGYGSNHGDPDHIWRVINYTLADFRKDVQKYIDAKKGDVLALMTKEEFDGILDKKIGPTYKFIDDIPDFFKPTIEKLVKEGLLNGTGTENGKAVLNLNYDLVRTLVILDRAGVFDKAQTVAAATAIKSSATSVKANIK